MNLTLFRCPHNIVCDTYNCHNMSAWFVGRVDGPASTTSKHCDECVKHMLSHLPEELAGAAGVAIPEPIVQEAESITIYVVLGEDEETEANILYIGTDEEVATEVNLQHVGSHIEAVSEGEVIDVYPVYEGEPVDDEEEPDSEKEPDEKKGKDTTLEE